MKLPKGWNEISIAKYLQIDNTLKDDTLDPIEREIEILCTLTGLDEDFFNSLAISAFKELVKRTSFLQSLPKDKLPKRFKVCGKYYKVITDARDITAGQYIDLMTYLKDTKNINNNAHKIMATICTPLKRTAFGFKELPYKGDEETHDLFLYNLTMDIVYPTTVFFCRLWEGLMPTIKNYLEQIAMEAKTITESQQLTDTTSNGDGY